MLVYTASTDDNSANGKLSFFDNGSVNENIVLQNVDITILDVVGNYVYYYADSSIYRVDIISKTTQNLINGDRTFDFNTSQTMNFDVDGNYLYILNGYTADSTTYYTERISLQNPTDHYFIGAFVSGEQPTDDEEE